MSNYPRIVRNFGHAILPLGIDCSHTKFKMHVLCLLRVDVWQAAAPAYAQATLSLWSDLLFNGHLVDASPSSGGMPSPNLSEDCGYSFCDKQSIDPGQSWWYPELLRQYWPKPTTYRVWGGHGQDLVIMTRKHEARGQYVIVGSIQPQSNIVGNTPLNVTACIVFICYPGTCNAAFEVYLCRSISETQSVLVDSDGVLCQDPSHRVLQAVAGGIIALCASWM